MLIGSINKENKSFETMMNTDKKAQQNRDISRWQPSVSWKHCSVFSECKERSKRSEINPKVVLREKNSVLVGRIVRLKETNLCYLSSLTVITYIQ